MIDVIMELETLNVTVQQIFTACNMIEKSLADSTKNDYDWKHEIREAIQEIRTETRSIIEDAEKH